MVTGLLLPHGKARGTVIKKIVAIKKIHSNQSATVYFLLSKISIYPLQYPQSDLEHVEASVWGLLY